MSDIDTPQPNASLAKSSIDDVQPPRAAAKAAGTGTSGQQDTLANKDQLRGTKDPTEEKGGELARRESRMDFGESDQRRAGGAELGAEDRKSTRLNSSH